MRPFLFWAGVVLTVDALVGLVGLNVWRRAVPNIPIGRIAVVEAFLALGLLAAYFLMA